MKKFAETYRKAAKLIEDGDADYSCYALHDVQRRFHDSDPTKARELYVDTFAPPPDPTDIYEDSAETRLQFAFDCVNSPIGRDQRALALCFMAAYAENP